MKKEDPYLYKEVGWNYESETRIILKFDKDLADTYKRVAVPFDDPLNYLDKYFEIYVWQSPWISDNKPTTKAAGHSFDEAQESRYKGKINMRSVCDTCSKRDNDNECKCQFKNQR